MIKSITETSEEIKLVFANPIDDSVANPIIASSRIFYDDLVGFISKKYNITPSIDMNFGSYLDIEDVFVINSKGLTRWEHQVELVIRKDKEAASQAIPSNAENKNLDTVTAPKTVAPSASPKSKATRHSK
jgi:hypothetical protein